ncbi:MAG: right-handed parallel beta-helix repeat-containing protein [Chloroflexia bacterium]|nr:right-handed parallel beta-helix repeat-containing protein [Chloroflexia bacterium]
MRFRGLCFAALIVLLAAGSATAMAMPTAGPDQATTWYVSTAGDDGNDCLAASSPCLTLQGALAKAASGDTLLIAAGTYEENLLLDKDITLQGLDMVATVIDGGAGGRVLEVPPGVHARVSRLTIANGFSASMGAGIYVSGTLELDYGLILGNSAAYGGSGGGLYNGGTLSMTYSLVQGNSASSWGGGLYNMGTAYIENSAIVSNTADSGGGLYNGGTMFLRNDTFSGNWVSNVAALYNQGYISLTNSTIAYNHVSGGARAGGVLASEMAGARFKNTIVSDNDNANCEDFGYYSDGDNIDSGTSCQFFQPSDQNNTDPLLGPLADNGGPSPTHALSGGPAVDMATHAGCPPTDQRGAPRPVDGGSGSSVCDVGAYEYLGIVPPLPSRPDLAVADFLHNAGATGLLDDPLGGQLELRVSNLGPAELAGGYTIALYVSADVEITPQDPLLDLGLLEGPPLAAGQEDVLVTLPDELGLPAGWPAGPAYLGVILDHSGFVAEGDEANNDASLPIYLLPAGPHSWEVASTADDGQDMGSLRFALDYARPTDTVGFSPTVFPPADPAVISLTAPITISQDDLTLDGTNAGVVLDGTDMLLGDYALVLTANRCQVLGLEIRNAPGGLLIGGDDNVIGEESTSECAPGMKVNAPPSTPHNVFRNNNGYGIEIAAGRQNLLLGNWLVGNKLGGVWVRGGEQTQIGGDFLYESNVIGGNASYGIYLSDDTQNNLIYGNYIGTAQNGLEPDPNGVGIRIDPGADSNSIGGADWCQGNLISANAEWGVVLNGDDLWVEGNLVGPFLQAPQEPISSTQGGIRIEGGSGISIGGERSADACDQACNLISGNGQHGLMIAGGDPQQVQVKGNFIGTDLLGNAEDGNHLDGIRIESGAGHVIGGGGEAFANLISGNEGAGIQLLNGVSEVEIRENTVGLSLDRASALGNDVGIWLGESTYTCAVQSNVIAGNRSHGIYLLGPSSEAHGITDNLIGTNAAQILGLGNGGAGIRFFSGANDNTIQDNVLIGNLDSGIWIEESSGNRLEQNLLSQNDAAGVQIQGIAAIGNRVWRCDVVDNLGVGLALFDYAESNIVSENQIDGNAGHGMALYQWAQENQVVENTIRDNGGPGIQIYSDARSNEMSRNEIYGNGGSGVVVTSAGATGNRISQNEIYRNAGLRIDNQSGGNTELPPPEVLQYIPQGGTVYTIEGRALGCSGCTVELFRQIPGRLTDASFYYLTAPTDGDGYFSFSNVGPHSGTYNDYFDLTLTDPQGNTSEYMVDANGLADLEVTAIEVVQTMQGLDNSVPLIAGKSGYVRVHVHSDIGIPVPARATLTIERDGQVIGPIGPNPSPACPSEIAVKQYPQRDQMQEAFCFKISPSWSQAGSVTLTAAVNLLPDYALLETGDYSNNVHTVSVDIGDPLEMPLYVGRIQHPEPLVERYIMNESFLPGDLLLVADVSGGTSPIFADELLLYRAAEHDVEIYKARKDGYDLYLRDTFSLDLPPTGTVVLDVAAGDPEPFSWSEVFFLYSEEDDLKVQVWGWEIPYTWDYRGDYNVRDDADGPLAVGQLNDSPVDEFLLSNEQSGQIWMYSRTLGMGGSSSFVEIELSGGIHSQVSDLLIVDVDLTGPYEIVVADASTEKAYFYHLQGDSLLPAEEIAAGGMLALGFSEGDALAIGDVDGMSAQFDGHAYAEILKGGDTCHCVQILRKQGSGDWALGSSFDSYGNLVYMEGGSLAVGGIYSHTAPLQVVSASDKEEANGRIWIFEKEQAGGWASVAPSDDLVAQTLSYFKRLYPISGVQVEIGDLYFSGTPDLGEVYAALAAAEWFSEGSPTWLALLEKRIGAWPGQNNGGRYSAACVGLDESSGSPQLVGTEVLIHETGHGFGLQHTWFYPSGVYDRPEPEHIYTAPRGVLGGPGPLDDLSILSLAVPTSPSLVGSYNPFGFAMDVHVEGDIAYVADFLAGLLVLDISDEANPTLLAQLEIGGATQSLDVQGDTAYIADAWAGLVVVDVSNPAVPQLQGAFLPADPETPEDNVMKHPYVVDVQVKGDYAYIIDYPYHAWDHEIGGRLRVIDVQDPLHPVQAWRSERVQARTHGDGSGTDPYRTHALFVDDRYVYVAAGAEGLVVFDFQDTLSPVYPAGRLSTVSDGDATDVEVRSDWAFVTYRDGFRTIYLGHDRTSPMIMQHWPVGPCFGVQVTAADYAYLACRLDGVRVMDIADPTNMQELGVYNPSDQTRWAERLYYANDRLYLVAWDTDVYGFDAGGALLLESGDVQTLAPQIFNSYNYADFMSYSFGGSWMSEFNYGVLKGKIQAVSLLRGGSGAGEGVRQGDALLVYGAVDTEAGTGELSLLVRGQEKPPTTLPLSSTLHLHLLGAGGQLLADYPLQVNAEDPSVGAEWSPGEGSFREVVPYVEGVQVIELRLEGQLVASCTVSAQAPQVALSYPNGGEVLEGEVELSWLAEDADGDEMRFALLYSADDGASWQVLVPLWSGTRYTLDTAALRGTSTGRFRVVALDGVNTAQDENDAPFTIPTRPPEVWIASPLEGAHLALSQTVLLLAEAEDPDGGPIADEDYVWVSDVDGPLGAGQGLYVSDLAPGWHTISLTVTDGQGEISTESVRIAVGVQYQLCLPLVLRSYPSP